MKNLLLIVANSSRARLYRVRAGRLELLERLEHPESRVRASDLVTDRPGRGQDDSGGLPHRSTMDPAEDPHEHEMIVFAREVARRTAILARRGRYPEVLLMAPPRFLGRVKSALDPGVARRIVASVSHDYTTKADAELVDILGTFGVRAALPEPV